MKKRILFITFNDCYGGGEIYLENIINKVNSDSNCTVFVYTPKIDKFIKNINLSNESINIGLSRYKSFLSIRNYNNYRQASHDINNIIVKNEIDTLFLNGKEAIYLAPFITKVKKVAVAHTFIDSPLICLKIIFHSISMLYINKLIFVSNIMQRQFNKITFNFFNEKLITIHNGVNIDKFINTKISNKNNKIVISNISRLEKEKGQDILIRAFYELSKKYNNIELRIGGEGKYENHLKDLVKELGLIDKVHLLGFIDPKDLLLETDIFVFPSILKESFGLVIIEAMSSSVPVIASNIGGIPEIINDKKNGLLFMPGNSKELSNRIESLILSKPLRKEIGLNGFNTVKRKFLLEDNIQKTLKVLHDI